MPAAAPSTPATALPPTAAVFQLRRIRTRDLRPARGNIREHLHDPDELAASLRVQGVLQPLIVNDEAGNLHVTDGHRRLEAARRAGLPTLPCLVTMDASTSSVLLTMLAAAMHRGLSPLEEGKAFARLRDVEHLPVADIALATGYTNARIRQRLLLLELPEDAQDLVADGAGTIAAATDLARQVKATRTGSVVSRPTRTSWFTAAHRLAPTVRSHCTHRDQRVLVGGVGAANAGR